MNSRKRDWCRASDCCVVLCLAIGLGIVTRWETDGGSKSSAKCFPDLRGELGPCQTCLVADHGGKRHNPPGGPVSLAKGLLAEKWLVSMAVLPSDRGRPVMKPKTTWDQGWLGGEVRAGLHRLPVCSKQVEMKALVSASMDGQQNRWWRVSDWYQDGSWATSICWWGQGGTVKSSKTSKVVALELRFQFQGPDVSIILYTWLYLQYSYKCPWLRFNY